jgi:hypothetical protein
MENDGGMILTGENLRTRRKLKVVLGNNRCLHQELDEADKYAL